MHSFESQQEEPADVRRERLLPILQESLKIFESTEPLERGCVRVTRKTARGVETFEHFVVCDINEDGPAFCMIEADGGPSAGATMLWSELVDVQKST